MTRGTTRWEGLRPALSALQSRRGKDEWLQILMMKTKTEEGGSS